MRARGIESDLALQGLVDDPPGDCDPDVLVPLRHIYDAGAWVILESAIADLPADLRWLLEAGAVSIEQLANLHRVLGTTSARDLTEAVQSQALRSVPGFDEATEKAVSDALPALRTAMPRIPLGRALETAEPFLAYLRTVPGVAWAVPAGSLRRGQDTVGDIELVAATMDPATAIEGLCNLPGVDRCVHKSADRVYLQIDRVQVAVRLVEPGNAGAALLRLTGSTQHLAALTMHAHGRGWLLTAEGLWAFAGEPSPVRSEEEFYSAVGLPYIPPEIRESGEEVEAARGGALPALVSRGDIRGDLHMHTIWSDGRDSIEAMVRSCQALGYQYLAITDHSQRSAAARSLTVKGVSAQADEIAQVRELFPDVAILHGCEVDIMPDGRLDFTDRILERFDIVLASLHERAGQSADQLMERYGAAMRHPLVTLITHPSNRLVPHRPGYDLDYDRLFQMAVETGTIVEIDGAPAHLDLDGRMARRAVAAGVMLAINSDSHRTEVLDRQMNLGITMARRGWVEPRHVLNTRTLAEVRAVIARKRSG